MINFPNGFLVTSKEPIDSRLVLTKEEMRNVKAARMPDNYLAVCKDDSKLYIYNIANDIDPEVGRFRLYTAEVTEDKMAVMLPGALRSALNAQAEDSGLEVDSEGNIKVSLDSDYLKVNDNHITFSDFIIQSVE